MELFEGFTRDPDTGLFSHPTVSGLSFGARTKYDSFVLQLWVNLEYNILQLQHIPATRENLEKLVIGLGGKL